jgi:hypothetical protein
MASLDDQTIRQALARLGQKLRIGRDVEILLVGGAAGVLIGALPAAWTTADVDVIHCHLPADRDAVLSAGADAGRELSLSGSWLSEDVGLYAWTLPDGWRERRILVGTFGSLKVYAASRLDLIAMKFIAHRERDLQHLALMKPVDEELEFCRNYLAQLEITHPDQTGRIQMARNYLEAWNTAE